jgi:prepilin-type N-terminal cleavage/methylation domain-containing protein
MNRAFTVLELMVVVLIIGILVAIGGPAFRSYVTKSKLGAAIQHLTYYQTQLLDGYQKNDYFPSTVVDLTAGAYTPSLTNYLEVIYYQVSTNSNAAYLIGYTSDTGVSGYVAPGGSGGGAKNAITMALVPTTTGYMQTYCGQWTGGAGDVPLTELPSNCQDTNISALIS